MAGEQFGYDVLSLGERETRFTFRGPFRELQDLRLAMSGVHQAENAAVAVMTLETLRQYYALIMEDEDLREGLARTFWPGRLETVSEQPRVVVDGAHNPEGMAALAAALRDLYRFGRLNVLLAMMADKNHEHSLRHILPMVDTLVITEPDFHRKMSASALAEVVEGLRERVGGPARLMVEPDWRRALRTVLQLAGEAPDQTLTLVTGSLYLVADVRSWLLHGKITEKGW